MENHKYVAINYTITISYDIIIVYCNIAFGEKYVSITQIKP